MWNFCALTNRVANKFAFFFYICLCVCLDKEDGNEFLMWRKVSRRNILRRKKTTRNIEPCRVTWRAANKQKQKNLAKSIEYIDSYHRCHCKGAGSPNRPMTNSHGHCLNSHGSLLCRQNGMKRKKKTEKNWIREKLNIKKYTNFYMHIMSIHWAGWR